jgi:hypothetical protein
MKRQARSADAHRLQQLRAQSPPTLNGIDYLEVAASDQRTLKVVFVHPVAGLAKANFRILGGVRITGIRLDAPIVAVGRDVTLHVDRAGDFSQYTLVLQDPAEPDAAPPQFDPLLSSISFSFKVGCPSDFDCAEERVCPPPAWREPQLDYLAKDYASFRRLMLDRLAQLLPQGSPSHPADFPVALVEMLAHVGDQLSYYQDAVGTEAYLGTARRRVSLRRHARLLDYPLHDGCNSRVFVAFEVRPAADGKVLPAATPVLTRGADDGPVEPAAILARLPDGATQVFQTMHALTLQSAHNQIRVHAWSAPNFCLGKGSTSAALVDDGALSLQPGALLVFQEMLSPTTGRRDDADRSRRHAVRLLTVEAGIDPIGALDPLTHAPLPVKLQLVGWHEQDALPFPVCVSAEFAVAGTLEVRSISVALGNVALAEHGLARSSMPLVPATVPEAGPYRPRLAEPGVAFAEPYSHGAVLASLGSAHPLSARAVLVQDPRAAEPQLQLVADDPNQAGDQPLVGSTPWRARRDLLASDRFAQEVVVETEHDGQAWLRFGDNRLGMAPAPGLRLLAGYRLGGGRAGNVGPESLTRVVTDDPAIGPHILALANPMAAEGGADPEPADAVKLLAPEAFRTQERAVTEDDYARVAERHPGVQRAAARLRWTGSWHTVYLTVDRLGGKPLDDAFRAELLQFMERYRLAGHDLELSDPVFVALDVALVVCVLPGYFAASVKQALLRTLGSARDPSGARGFFDPDNFTFGRPLLLSRLLEAAIGVAGVASIEVLRLQRWGRLPDGEIASGRIDAAPLEVLRLDNDPNFPENGRLELDLRGGI